jgi:tRNA (guanine-N7-)-methyltransferase
MHKTIRSFVKRQRTLGITKQKIFEEMWPKYGLDVTSEKISPEKIFGRHAPLILEIGFGNGETLFSLAQKYPQHDFIGIEVHKPGIASFFSQFKNHHQDNVRIYNDDAVVVLQQCIPNKSLDKILLLFPDPWPKKRHHKRRLIQPEFVQLLQNKLKSEGILHIATDWENYAKHIEAVLKENLEFSILNPSNSSPLLQYRPIITKFEQRGKNKGHQIFEIMFINAPIQHINAK